MDLSIIIVDCGCPYLRRTWKEDSICAFCTDIKQGKRKNSEKARIVRGWTYNDESGLIKHNGYLLKCT
jgi:hypothetical protein